MQKKTGNKILLGFFILLLVLTGGYIYWQQHKKGILRTAIQKEVLKGTDSLYRISYDSSYIDEINGDLKFFNISMQSDSLLEKYFHQDSLPQANIFKIHIKQLNILGADLPAFLSNTAVSARQIDILAPHIEIIQTGKKNPGSFSREDSLAIYERITGKFNRIETQRINIQEGSLRLLKSFPTAQTKTIQTTPADQLALTGITIAVNDFKIDRTRNYENIISYFIHDIELNVSELKQRLPKTILSAKNFNYNAKQKRIRIDEIDKSDSVDKSPRTRLLNLSMTGISTEEFIRNKKIRADSLLTDGGVVTLKTNLQKQNGDTRMEISNDFFESIWVKNIVVGSTDLIIYNTQKPRDNPLRMKNFKFSASDIQELIDGNNLKDLIAKANWKFSADGFSILTADKQYRAQIGPFALDKKNRTAYIQHLSLLPMLSEAAFVKTLDEQKDQLNLRANHIQLQAVDLETLLISQKLIAESGSMQPILKIFNDRTVPYSTQSKVGKYPQQLLMRMKFPIHIQRLKVKDGYVSYRERGHTSKQIGNVFFSNIQGEIKNISNIPSYVQKNNQLVVDASAQFLGAANLKTTWHLMLNSPHGAFTAKGTCGPFDASLLSQITEPLGMASISEGKINKLTFQMQGDDLKSKGEALLLYEGLKIKLLKPGEDSTSELENKALMTGIVNMFMKSNNPNRGKIRTSSIDFRRDVYKSFFNLLWKSIFDAVKKIAI